MKDEFDVILFDNDGVLVDTEPLFLKATQELLATVDVALDVDLYREICLVQGNTVFVLAEEKGLTAAEILKLRGLRDARYMEMIEAGVGVLEGVDETLSQLHGVRPLAIVTSSGRPHFDRIHDQTRLLRYFEFVLADGDYARHKPHPDPYLAAAKRFGVECGRCLVIEDTERGLKAASAAGMRCIVIPNPLAAKADLASAHAVVSSVRDVPRIVASLIA